MPTASQISTTTVTSHLEFSEENYICQIFGHKFHYRWVAISAGLFGFFSVCLVFVFTICKFTWTRYEESVDVLALIGFCVFLVSGTFVHFCILLSVKKYDPVFLNPPIIFHSFLILMGVIMALTSIGELVTDDIPQLDESEILAKQFLLTVPFLILFSSMILSILVKFRKYLKRRASSTGVQGNITPVLFGVRRIEVNVPEVKPDD